MANWLVTGGCGFIGSHLVETLLRRGDKVRVLDDLSTGKRDNLPDGVDLIVGDVADPAAVGRAAAGVEGIFHLAAIASVERCRQDWIGCHRTNLTGTITVFEAAARLPSGPPIPVVYTSSAAVYGDNARVPLRETETTRPLSAYGADKLACELNGNVAWLVHRVPNTGLRLFNVYGPRQDPSSPYSGVIAIFADSIAVQRGIRIFGDGRQTRDFIYVADVVAHFLQAMAQARQGAQVFNVCTGGATSVLDLATAIAKLAGVPLSVRHESARIGDITASTGDPSAAIEAFGLAARTSLADGLARTLNFAG
jgi:UDP-glucose 4-epimerase